MEAISVGLTQEALSDTSSHLPHRVQVWNMKDGTAQPSGFWAIRAIGVDYVMFSADYPHVRVKEASAGFDTSLLSHKDSVKVGRESARRLFRTARDA
jgi:predicted TIM-barrel fold metal-dependent hydrolase